MDKEEGVWFYKVTSPSGLHLLSPAAAVRPPRFLPQGAVFSAQARARLLSTGELILQIEGESEWFCTKNDSLFSCVAETQLQAARWACYRVVFSHGVQVRSASTVDDAFRTKRVYRKGEVVNAVGSLTCGDVTFIKLADGGWLFESRTWGDNRWTMAQGFSQHALHASCRVLSQKLDTRLAPSTEAKVLSGAPLKRGDVFGASALAEFESGEKWVQCQGNGGWLLFSLPRETPLIEVAKMVGYDPNYSMPISCLQSNNFTRTHGSQKDTAINAI